VLDRTSKEEKASEARTLRKAQWQQGGEQAVAREIPLHPKSRVGKHLQHNPQRTAPVEVPHAYFNRFLHEMFNGNHPATIITDHPERDMR